ncbi:RNA polymerase sigma factor [Robinsoniella peoriensis]|uniref:RNA polymerase sigma factor n=1 Tax=Robinsoniella peoriensis TaxID=180332 RepID=UPI00375265CA
MDQTEESQQISNKLEQIYCYYEQKMYRIAYSILHNVEQAEDAVQDSILRVIPILSSVDEVESLKTKRLITQITKNVAIDRYRKNKRDYNTMVTESTSQNIDGSRETKHFTDMLMDQNMIKQILDEVLPKYREIIRLRCFYELSYLEIAAILEISEDAAMKRFERAKKIVRNMIGDDIYEQ